MLRIGLLLDSTNVSSWVHETIISLQQMPNVEIVLAVVNKSTGNKTNDSSTFVYRTLRNIDRKLMRLSGDPFNKKKLELNNIPFVNVHPVQTQFSDRFPAETISEIRKYDIDIFLRFGFRILRGEILSVARYGIISLHHGDTRKYRGGPPAFWEVVNKHPVTTVTVQQLTEELDGGNILSEATLRTDKNSFYRNQAKLYHAGREALLNVIADLSKDPANYFLSKKIAGKYCYTDPLYKNPGNVQSFKILCNWMWQNISRKIVALFYTSQWQMIYAKASAMPGSFHRYKKLLPAPDRIWADPFVIFKDKYYVFFEEKLNKEKNAHISLIEISADLKTISKPSVVLKETFHLSYPFVFADNNEWYMLPESASANELILYKASAFPNSWTKIKVLLSGKRIYDATLHKQENIWYLFCNEKSDDRLSSDAYLHIYFSGNLLNEPFKPHPLNPVYRNVTCARPAGKLFHFENRLIRPSQISAPDYGAGIQLNEVITLSPTHFEEKPIEQLLPKWDKSLMGMHTINHAAGLTVADIQTKRFRWF